MSVCPECGAKLKLEDVLHQGEIVVCPDCSLDPMTVELAPEVEEDGGE